MLNLGALEFTLGVNTRALDAATNRVEAFGKKVANAQYRANRGWDDMDKNLRQVENTLLKAGESVNKITRRIQASSLTPKVKTEMITRLNREYNDLTKAIANADTAADKTRLDRNFGKFINSTNNLEAELQQTAKAERDLATAARTTESALMRQNNALTTAAERARNLQTSILTNNTLGGADKGALLAQTDAALQKFKNSIQGPEPLKPSQFAAAANKYKVEIGEINRKFRQLKSDAVAPAVQGFERFKTALASGGSAMLLINGHLGGMSTRMIALSTIVGRFGLAMGIAAGSIAAVTLSINGLVRGSLSAALQIEKAEKAMTALTGSSFESARQIDYLKGVATQAGVEFQSLTSSYARFLAASSASGQALSTTQDWFAKIAQTSATLGLSVEDTQGTIKAFEQIMSKGTVQAEELRGQLGDRLPAAFAIAADAMGVTTRELGEMMKKGELLSTEFMPKFIDAMTEFYGIDMSTPVDTLQASINRASNAVTFFFDAVGNNLQIVSAAKQLLNAFSNTLAYLQENMATIIKTTAAWTAAIAGAIAGWVAWAAAIAAFTAAGTFITWLGATISLIRTAKTVTELWTVAQIALNAAMMANPLGAVAALIARIAVAVAGAVLGYKLMTSWINNSSAAFDAGQGHVEGYITTQRRLGYQIKETTDQLIKQQKILAQQKAQEWQDAADDFVAAQAKFDAAEKKLSETATGGRGSVADIGMGKWRQELLDQANAVNALASEANRARNNLKGLQELADLPTEMPVAPIQDMLGGDDTAKKVKDTSDAVRDLIEDFHNMQMVAQAALSGPDAAQAAEALIEARDALNDLKPAQLAEFDAKLAQAGFSAGTLQERLAALIVATDRGADSTENFLSAWEEIDTAIDDLADLEAQLRAMQNGIDPSGIETFQRALEVVKDLDPEQVEALTARMLALGIAVDGSADGAEALALALANIWNQTEGAESQMKVLQDFFGELDDIAAQITENGFFEEGLKLGLRDDDLNRFIDMNMMLDEYRNRMIAAGEPTAVVNARLAEMRQRLDELGESDAALERVQELSNYADDAARAIGDFAKAVIIDFNDIGKSFERLVDRILDMVIEMLIIAPLLEFLQGLLGGLIGGFSSGGSVGGKASTKSVSKNASGGLIAGSAGGTADTELIRASTGEYIMSAAAVDRIGVSNLDAMNNGGSGVSGRAEVYMEVALSADLDARIATRADERIAVHAPKIIKGAVAATNKVTNRKGVTQ